MKLDIPPGTSWRNPMKTMILAAVAALSLSVGVSAFAAGAPAGGSFQPPAYGSQSSKG
jgi:hypothetical protein